MLKIILLSLMFITSIAIAAEKNEDFYVNDCDSYGQMAFATVYLRSTPIIFPEGKRLMTREEYIKKFNQYMIEKSKIPQAKAEELLGQMLDVWDKETDGDPMELYLNYKNKCEKIH